MAFAQSHYQQKQGINGQYTIASIGCFLTSFCNLLQDNGKTIDPPSLDNYFRDHNTYVDIDDGIRDDLGWSSIAAYDSSIMVTNVVDRSTNQTAGWPSTNNAIVRFYYRSVHSGQMIFHFCKVADANAHTVIDSWDGVVKHSPYGEPTAWAEYGVSVPQPVQPTIPVFTIESIVPKQMQLKKESTNLWNISLPYEELAAKPLGVDTGHKIFTAVAIAHHNSQNNYYMADGTKVEGYNVLDCEDYIPPAPAPPAAPLPFPTSTEPYTVVKTIMGFDTSNNAANHTNAKNTVDAGQYYVFNRRYSSADPNVLLAINVTKTLGKSGSWINPTDNVEEPPAPVAPPAVSDWNPPTPTPPPVEPLPWRATYTPFLDTGGNPRPVLYIGMEEYAVKDLATERPDAYLHEDQRIWIAGTFTGPDSVTYARPEEAVRNPKTGQERRYWYGIRLDKGIIEPASVFDTQTSLQERQVTHNLTTTDYLMLGLKEVEKVWDVVWPFKKRK